jgi:hypothetical protein
MLQLPSTEPVLTLEMSLGCDVDTVCSKSKVILVTGRGLCVRLTSLPPSVSRLPIRRGILNISQTYKKGDSL